MTRDASYFPSKKKPLTDEEKQRIAEEGSVLGNIAREYGRPKLGDLMDDQALKEGDIHQPRRDDPSRK